MKDNLLDIEAIKFFSNIHHLPNAEKKICWKAYPCLPHLHISVSLAYLSLTHLKCSSYFLPTHFLWRGLIALFHGGRRVSGWGKGIYFYLSNELKKLHWPSYTQPTNFKSPHFSSFHMLIIHVKHYTPLTYFSSLGSGSYIIHFHLAICYSPEKDPFSFNLVHLLKRLENTV